MEVPDFFLGWILGMVMMYYLLKNYMNNRRVRRFVNRFRLKKDGVDDKGKLE
jgi:hypothetical protein